MIPLLQGLLYAVLGLVVENVFTGVSAILDGDVRAPTRSYLWMPVVWALGGFFFHFLGPWVAHVPQYWLRGLVWTLATYVLEFGSGLLLLATIRVVPWDYRSRTRGAALWGTINWRYLPYWLTLGMFVEPAQAWILRLATALAYS